MQYKLKYLELVDVTWHDGVDVPVPQVVNDLGEVDLFGEGPGHVLAHAWSSVESGCSSLIPPLVKYFGIDVLATMVVDYAGALVSPNLSHLGQFSVPPVRSKGSYSAHYCEIFGSI